MKVLAFLILVFHSLFALSGVTRYYTNFYYRGSHMGNPVARRQYMNCVAKAKVLHRKDLFDDDNYWAEVNRCKSVYNKVLKQHPPYI